jgi:hypothetical protein
MTSDKTALRRDLFLRGAPSYVDALVALEAFEQEVQAMCKKAYSRHKDRLLPAMGLSDGGDCELYKDGEPAERWAAVGVRRGIQRSGLNGPCFYVYLWFGSSEDDQAEMLATVWLDFPAKRLRDEVYDQIRRKNPRCGIERNDEDQYWAIVLSTPFTPDSPATGPEETLDKVLSDWIGCCESIDGLKLSGR